MIAAAAPAAAAGATRPCCRPAVLRSLSLDSSNGDNRSRFVDSLFDVTLRFCSQVVEATVSADDERAVPLPFVSAVKATAVTDDEWCRLVIC